MYLRENIWPLVMIYKPCGGPDLTKSLINLGMTGLLSTTDFTIVNVIVSAIVIVIMIR